MKTRQQICKYITSQSWFNDFNYNLIKARKINFYVYLYAGPKYTGLDILERLIVNAFYEQILLMVLMPMQLGI